MLGAARANGTGRIVSETEGLDQPRGGDAADDLYRQVFSGLPVAVYVWDVVRGDQGEITVLHLADANPPALALLGRDLDEVRGESLDDLLGSGAWTGVLPIAERVMRSGEPFIHAACMERLGKELRCTVFPLGEHLAAVAEDITALAARSRDLEVATSQLESIASAGVVGLTLSMSDGSVLEANDFFLDLVGRTRDELHAGMLNLRALTPPEWLPADEAALDQLAARGACDPFREEYLRSDGTRVTALVVKTRPGGPEYPIVTLLVDLAKLASVEEQLRSSEERFAKAFDVGPVGMTITRVADGRFADVNEAFLRMFEREREEVIGHTSTELDMWAPEERARLIQLQREAGGPRSIEFTARAKSGRGVPILLSSAPITVEGEDHLVTVMLDISDRKLLESVLLEHARLLSEVQRVAKIGGWEFNPATGKGTWTDEGARVLGLDPADPASAETARGYYRGEDGDRLERAIREVVDHGTEFTIEAQATLRDGTVKWIETRGAPVVEDGATVLVRGSIQDVTERHEARDAAARSEALFAAAFDRSPVAATLGMMPGMQFVAVNAAFEDLTGYTAGEFVGQDSAALSLWVDPEARARVLSRLRDEGSVDGVEFEFRDKSGRIGTALYFAETIRTPEADYVLSKVLDITARKAAELVLARTAEELETLVAARTADLKRANEEMEAFTYSVSHDLRAPLRHITGYIELLERRYRDGLDDQARHYLDSVSGSARQMGYLIDALLHISRTSRLELVRSRVDMAESLAAVLRDLDGGQEGRDIRWDIGPLPPVMGDRGMLRLVWRNLAENAIKYTRAREVAHISVSAERAEGEVVFRVSDDGAGFDMRYAGKLFGVFQRLHPTAEYEGTGIGLATVRRIVERHGGRTWAEGEPGAGATFWFSIPEEREAP